MHALVLFCGWIMTGVCYEGPFVDSQGILQGIYCKVLSFQPWGHVFGCLEATTIPCDSEEVLPWDFWKPCRDRPVNM